MTRRGSTALRHALLTWYRRGHRDLPWRRTRDPYAILVSEVMLQQTQADRVIPKYREFLQWFPDFRSLAQASTGDVIRAWSPLGYNMRAVRLHRLARQVMERFDGRLPQDAESLRGLDGVGEYTASAVACFAFGKEVAVIDTNVRRVVRRLFWETSEPSQAELARRVSELVPAQEAYDWNQALMELGATVCVARRPACGVCPLRARCRTGRRAVNGAPRIAEAKAAYRTERFEGSRRYYRGRIVDLLRALNDREMLSISKLGCALKPGFGVDDLPWLQALVADLARDGLVRVAANDARSTDTLIALP